jgi:hypothetical protein
MDAMIKTCSDTNICSSLSIFSDEIKEYYERFVNMDLILLNKVELIGKTSGAINGTIYSLPYFKTGNTCYAIMKRPQSRDADNLMYEAFAGNIINLFYKWVPCFTETYAFGVTTDKNLKKTQFKMEPIENVTTNLASTSCVKNEDFCVIAQQLMILETLDEQYKSLQKTFQYWELTVPSQCFQLYAALDKLKNQFTHYDLHTSNVLVSYPTKNQNEFTKLRYYYSANDVVEISTLGIVKIIDYGRAFVSKTADENSKTWIKKAESSKECKDLYKTGYGQIYDKYSYMDRSTSNVSHDLRILNYQCDDFYYSNFGKDKEMLMYSMCRKVTYTKEHGTKEIKAGKYPNKIVNVSDAHKCLYDIVVSEKYKRQSDEYFKNKQCIGVLHIWINETRNMVFTES